MSENPRDREMYMLTLDGKPVVVWWTTGRPRRPIYRTVGQAGAPVWLYKTMATVKRHAARAYAQGGISPSARYGYVTPRDDGRLQLLREPLNVDELKGRDRLVRRLRKIRTDAVLDKNTIEHWNRLHPNDPPFSTAFEDAMIAFCDGKGPLPENSDAR